MTTGKLMIIALLAALRALPFHAAAESAGELPGFAAEYPSAAHVAARRGNIEALRREIAAGIDIESPDAYGATLLHLAVFGGSEEAVGLLLAAGADVDARDRFGRSPLHRAVGRGWTTLAKQLLAAGADVSAIDQLGMRPLHLAVPGGRRDLVALLVENGGDIAAADNAGETPLYHAIDYGAEPLLDGLLLSEQTAAIANNEGKTPVYRAAETNRTGILKKLVAIGADIGVPDNKGDMPIHAAARLGHAEAVSILLGAGQSVAARDGEGGTPLRLAADNYRGDVANTIKNLVAAGAEKDERSPDGKTPLHYATRLYNGLAAKALIELGADVNAVDHSGASPLRLANQRYNEQAPVVKFLMAAGAEEIFKPDADEAASEEDADAKAAEALAREFRKLRDAKRFDDAYEKIAAARAIQPERFQREYVQGCMSAAVILIAPSWGSMTQPQKPSEEKFNQSLELASLGMDVLLEIPLAEHRPLYDIARDAAFEYFGQLRTVVNMGGFSPESIERLWMVRAKYNEYVNRQYLGQSMPKDLRKLGAKYPWRRYPHIQDVKEFMRCLPFTYKALTLDEFWGTLAPMIQVWLDATALYLSYIDNQADSSVLLPATNFFMDILPPRRYYLPAEWWGEADPGTIRALAMKMRQNPYPATRVAGMILDAMYCGQLGLGEAASAARLAELAMDELGGTSPSDPAGDATIYSIIARLEPFGPAANLAGDTASASWRIAFLDKIIELMLARGDLSRHVISEFSRLHRFSGEPRVAYELVSRLEGAIGKGEFTVIDCEGPSNDFSFLSQEKRMLLNRHPGLADRPRPPRGTADGSPRRLAVIAADGTEKLADMLFAEIAKSKDFELVERGEIARILAELSLDGVAASRTGRLKIGDALKANLLALLDKSAESVRFTLVETAGAAVLTEDVLPPAVLSTPEAAVKLLAARLKSPPPLPQDGTLVNVVILPGDGSPDLLGRRREFNVLLGAHLRAAPGVLALERERLYSIVDEKTLTGDPDYLLDQADFLVRPRLEHGSQDKLKLSLSLRRRAGGEEFIAAEFAPADLAANAADTAVKMLAWIGGEHGDNSGYIPAEAELYSSVAAPLFARGRFLEAAAYYEVASLLLPDNFDFRLRFLNSLNNHIAASYGNSTNRVAGLAEEIYMELIDSLRRMIRVGGERDGGEAFRAMLGRHPSQQRGYWPLLGRPVANLTPENQATVAACRNELRGLLEQMWKEDLSKPPQFRRVISQPVRAHIYPQAPLFFEFPDAAAEYILKLAAEWPPEFVDLAHNPFPNLGHWRSDDSWEVWTRLLRGMAEGQERETRGTALAALAFSDRHFQLEWYLNVPPRPETLENIRTLTSWFTEDPDNLAWFVGKFGKSKPVSDLWAALSLLPPAERLSIFESLFGELLSPADGVVGWEPFRLLGEAAAADNSVKEKCQFLAAATLELVGKKDPAARRNFEERLKLEKWYAGKLEAGEVPGLFAAPEIDGTTLVLDTLELGSDRLSQHFEEPAILVDGSNVWVAWGEANAVAVARICLESSQTIDTWRIPPRRLVSTARIARDQRFLYIAGNNLALAVPFRGDGSLAAEDAISINSDFPDGGSLAAPYKSPRRRHITSISPGPDGLYLGVSGESHRGRNRYGAIARWRPLDGHRELELIAACDSLAPGGLNDCQPYWVAAGFPHPDGHSMLFALKNTPNQDSRPSAGQRSGIWRYDPEKQVFSPILHHYFPGGTRQRAKGEPYQLGHDFFFGRRRLNFKDNTITNEEFDVRSNEPGGAWKVARQPNAPTGASLEIIFTPDGGRQEPTKTLTSKLPGYALPVFTAAVPGGVLVAVRFTVDAEPDINRQQFAGAVYLARIIDIAD